MELVKTFSFDDLSFYKELTVKNKMGKRLSSVFLKKMVGVNNHYELRIYNDNKTICEKYFVNQKEVCKESLCDFTRKKLNELRKNDII